MHLPSINAPGNTCDVSTMFHTSLDTSCRVGVKVGGHGRDPDDSVSVSGVTIDMQKMNLSRVPPTDRA
jgi:hypothetical protein